MVLKQKVRPIIYVFIMYLCMRMYLYMHVHLCEKTEHLHFLHVWSEEVSFVLCMIKRSEFANSMLNVVLLELIEVWLLKWIWFEYFFEMVVFLFNWAFLWLTCVVSYRHSITSASIFHHHQFQAVAPSWWETCYCLGISCDIWISFNLDWRRRINDIIGCYCVGAFTRWSFSHGYRYANRGYTRDNNAARQWLYGKEKYSLVMSIWKYEYMFVPNSSLTFRLLLILNFNFFIYLLLKYISYFVITIS